ncbi:MAG TPA: methyltransferase domain-containing protein [Thermoplasmata archaeon]|nr:methyltransferase domain-containing protein [Thermoplasmata archaeon]
MRRYALEVLACPRCHGSLACADPAQEVTDGVLECLPEGVSFAIEAGVPHLVRPERAEAVASLGQRYSRVWRQDGWGAAGPAYLLALPYQDLSGRAVSRWRIKARSLDALLSLLGELGPKRVLDLGSGVGWLAYHLSGRGYDAYAVDAVLDDVLGLAASATYIQTGAHFERIWGELENPPFQDATFDAVVCNASLHYGAWHDTLSSIARVLRPGGSLIVLNSPVHRDSRSAIRAASDFQSRLRGLGADEDLAGAYHHFTRQELEAAVSAHFGPVREWPFNPGLGFRWSRRLKGLLLHMEFASFPILYAQKRVEGRAP